MTRMYSPLTLRGVLLLDAATCAAMGALLALASGFAAGLTGLPSGLLLAAGLALFPVAAFLAFAGTRSPLAPALVWLAILGNLLWILASVALPLAGWVSPTAVGLAFLLVQAGVVALLTLMEYVALRGRRTPAAI